MRNAPMQSPAAQAARILSVFPGGPTSSTLMIGVSPLAEAIVELERKNRNVPLVSSFESVLMEETICPTGVQ